MNILKNGSVSLFIRIFHSLMRIKLWDFLRLSFLNLLVEGLDNHFTDPLAGSHNVCGIHRLVRGNQDETLAAVRHGRISRLIGSKHIIFDTLTGAVFHEGNMLMCGRMIDDVRVIFCENLEDSAGIPNRTDKHSKLQFRKVLPKFQLYAIRIIFINIKNNELLRIVSGNLPAKLRAYASSAAGDQYRLSVNKAENLL